MADDIISMLPDQVLCHILSFLPIHIAAATSILSKRWTPLWLSVPSLYFDDRSYLLNNNKPYDCFNKFIYKTIVARDAHLPIRMFRLKCRASNFELSDYDLNTWINAATQRGLEDLHIKLPITSTTVLRMSRVFSCKTLVVLKLTGLDVNVFSFVDLPSLKTLHLSQVGFPKPQYLMELLCGCPILEDMYLYNITYVDTSTPSDKNFKSLSKLVRAFIYKIGLDIPLMAICSIQFLLIDKYCDAIPVFPNLTCVDLIFGSDMSWHFVLSMLKKCPKLQILKLVMRKSSHVAVWAFPCFVPECLSSQLKTCFIMNYKGASELHFAKYIMENSRALLTMAIGTTSSSKLEDKFQQLKELSSYPRTSPICQLLFI